MEEDDLFHSIKIEAGVFDNQMNNLDFLSDEELFSQLRWLKQIKYLLLSAQVILAF